MEVASERVKEGGKEAEIELWAAKVLRSDYTAADLGEGGRVRRGSADVANLKAVGAG